MNRLSAETRTYVEGLGEWPQWPLTVHIAIGNSDDKLTQTQWAAFVHAVHGAVDGLKIHGAWLSPPDAPWQNACWAVELTNPATANALRTVLAQCARRWRQDSIAWTPGRTEFIRPEQP